MPRRRLKSIRGPIHGHLDHPLEGTQIFQKVQNNMLQPTATLTCTSSETKITMSNTTPDTQTPTNPTNNQNVAVKQLTKEEVKAVAKFNQKKKDKETIRLLNYF